MGAAVADLFFASASTFVFFAIGETASFAADNDS